MTARDFISSGIALPPVIDGPAVAFSGRDVLAPFRLPLQRGRWIAILGPSGVGKSTLLKIIAGLLPPHPPPLPPQALAWMGQSDLLLPWLSALDNALLGARLRGEPAQMERAVGLLQQAGLGDALARRPAQLSGGMRQRVALVRTLMEPRPLVLMDEPFAALDPPNRQALHQLAARLLADRAVIFVTHDPQEALALADDIFVLGGSPAKLRAAVELPPFTSVGPRPRDPLTVELLPALRQLQAMLAAAAAGANAP